jgi:hypothetical protein
MYNNKFNNLLTLSKLQIIDINMNYMNIEFFYSCRLFKNPNQVRIR